MRIIAAQHGLMRDINKASVLSVIRQKEGISKSDIASLLGLNKTTVTSCVYELLKERLIKELGLVNGSQGRPPLLLEFDGTYCYVVGVALEMGKADIVVTDLNGSIVIEKQYQINTRVKESLLNELTTAITDTITQSELNPSDILGVGIGSPGIVNKSTGIITQSTKFMGLRDIPLREYMSSKLGMNIYVEENASAAMAGNYFFGNAKQANNMIYLHISTGIGSGIMLRGEMYIGSGGYAPKLGHSMFEVMGKKCGCGNRGCFEKYASEMALVEYFTGQEVKVEEQDIVRYKATGILEMAEQGQNDAYKAVMHVGKNLGIGLGSMINMYNPDHVIIGSRMTRIDGFMTVVKSSIHETAFPHLLEDLIITPAFYGDNAVAMGAASLVIEEILSFPKLGGHQ